MIAMASAEAAGAIQGLIVGGAIAICSWVLGFFSCYFMYLTTTKNIDKERKKNHEAYH